MSVCLAAQARGRQVEVSRVGGLEGGMGWDGGGRRGVQRNRNRGKETGNATQRKKVRK